MNIPHVPLQITRNAKRSFAIFAFVRLKAKNRNKISIDKMKFAMRKLHQLKFYLFARVRAEVPCQIG